MSPPRLQDTDLEYGETDAFNRDGPEPFAQPVPTRSIYSLTRQEITRGVANRFVHSRTYIFLYLGMASLSVTTIVLSLVEQCPGLAFYILEIIVNTSMILEVVIRFVAFGRQFWKSPFNIMDLIVTAFCAVTLLVLAFAECGAGSKEEELFDTLLLIARNILQFTRLATVMRQSGQSIFSRPKPIDINAARRAGFGLDVDMDSDEEGDAELGRPLFDANAAEDENTRAWSQRPPPPRTSEEDVWASMQ